MIFTNFTPAQKRKLLADLVQSMMNDAVADVVSTNTPNIKIVTSHEHTSPY